MASTFASTNVSRYLDAGTYKGGTAVKAGASSNSVQNVAATTDRPAGVLVRDPDVGYDGSVDTIAVCIAGPATGLAGAAVEVDDDVVITATGTLVPKSAAGWVVGKAMSKAANGEYFELLVNIRKEPA